MISCSSPRSSSLVRRTKFGGFGPQKPQKYFRFIETSPNYRIDGSEVPNYLRTNCGQHELNWESPVTIKPNGGMRVTRLIGITRHPRGWGLKQEWGDDNWARIIIRDTEA